MGDITETNTLDRLVGLSKMASNAVQRTSVIQDLQDHRLELMGDSHEVSLDETDKAKVVDIGASLVNGQVRDIWQGNAQYSSLYDVMDETMNEMVGFGVEGRFLSGIQTEDMDEVIKHNFPESADVFEIIDGYSDRQDIELNAGAPAVMAFLASYIAAFDPKLIGACDAECMVRPIETHGDFMDSDTRLQMRYLAQAVSDEIMMGTNHHIYRMAKLDSQDDTDSPEQVMEKLSKVMKQKESHLSFLDKVAIYGNQPRLPEDLQVDLDAHRGFDDYHLSQERSTKEWATDACHLGAAFLPHVPLGTNVQAATKFVYPVGLAQKLHEYPDAKVVQKFMDVVPKSSPVSKVLGVDLEELSASNNNHDDDFTHD